MSQATFQKEVVFKTDFACHARQFDSVRGTARTHVRICASAVIASDIYIAFSGMFFGISSKICFCLTDMSMNL